MHKCHRRYHQASRCPGKGAWASMQGPTCQKLDVNEQLFHFLEEVCEMTRVVF